MAKSPEKLYIFQYVLHTLVLTHPLFNSWWLKMWSKLNDYLRELSFVWKHLLTAKLAIQIRHSGDDGYSLIWLGWPSLQARVLYILPQVPPQPDIHWQQISSAPPPPHTHPHLQKNNGRRLTKKSWCSREENTPGAYKLGIQQFQAMKIRRKNV